MGLSIMPYTQHLHCGGRGLASGRAWLKHDQGFRTLLLATLCPVKQLSVNAPLAAHDRRRPAMSQ
jgi:hypothetical protein